MAGNGTALAQRQQNLKSLLERAQPTLARTLPAHLNAERMVRIALLAAVKNPALYECDPLTVISALQTAAALGLEPDGTLGSAYLVPFRNNRKGTMECQLIPGYRGYIDLARRAGSIEGLEARLVYDDDLFDVDYGSEPKITHKPNLTSQYRGTANIVAVYAVARLTRYAVQFEVMTRAEVDVIRAGSKQKDGVWKDHFGEMARKTVVRRICKYLPLSPELARLIEHDNRMDSGEVGGVDPEMDTVEGLTRAVQASTAERAEELRQRVGRKPEGQPEVGSISGDRPDLGSNPLQEPE